MPVVTPGVVARIKGGFPVQNNRPRTFCRYFAIVVISGVVIKRTYCIGNAILSISFIALTLLCKWGAVDEGRAGCSWYKRSYVTLVYSQVRYSHHVLLSL